MFLDYFIVPLICTVYGALTVQRLLPEVPYVVLAAAFAGTMTLINLRGIRTTARTNFVLATIMSAVILIFIVLAMRLLFHQPGWHGVFSTQPFYDPATFHASSIAVGTWLAALTYTGLLWGPPTMRSRHTASTNAPLRSTFESPEVGSIR
jgi:amino acid transporter